MTDVEQLTDLRGMSWREIATAVIAGKCDMILRRATPEESAEHRVAEEAERAEQEPALARGNRRGITREWSRLSADQQEDYRRGRCRRQKHDLGCTCWQVPTVNEEE